MIGFHDLRRGTIIELDGEPWLVTEYSHTKVTKQAPTLTLRLKHLKTGRVMERKLPGDRQLQLAQVEHVDAQFLYNEGEVWHFMDQETFEQYAVGVGVVEDYRHYLTDGLPVTMVFYNGEPISLEMPTAVELEVVETTPGFKGDTAQGGNKPATVETGLTLQVPLFVNEGDRIRVDTRTGAYIERA